MRKTFCLLFAFLFLTSAIAHTVEAGWFDRTPRCVTNSQGNLRLSSFDPVKVANNPSTWLIDTKITPNKLFVASYQFRDLKKSEINKATLQELFRRSQASVCQNPTYNMKFGDRKVRITGMQYNYYDKYKTLIGKNTIWFSDCSENDD